MLSESRTGSAGSVEFHTSSRVQVVGTHGKTAQDDVALINHGDITRGDLNLGSNGFNNTSAFTLEDQATGGVEVGGRTIRVVLKKDETIISPVKQES